MTLLYPKCEVDTIYHHYVFRMCERLKVECVCGDSVTLDSPVTGSGRDSCPALLSCPRAKSCGGFPLQAEERIINSMELLIRSVPLSPRGCRI